MSSALCYPKVRLEELVDVLDHLRAPINGEERSRRIGSVPYYGANGQQGWIDTHLTDEPLILLAEDGGNFDEFADRPIAYRVEGPAWVNNHAHVLRARAGVSQSFIFWSIAHKDIRQYIAGGTRTKLTQGELRRIEISVPEEPAQQVIGEVLDTLDTTLRQTEALIDKLKLVKQGLLHDLLTRGIDANGELRPPQSEAPGLYKDSVLGWIPREWIVEKLPDLALGGLMNGVFKEPKRVGSGVALVNVADLYRGQNIDLGRCERFAATSVEVEKFGAKRGDIFFTRSSLKLEGIAQTSFLDDEADDAVFECHVMRLRPNPAKAVPRFLKEWCVAQRAREHFMGHAKQVTMTTISQDGIASLPCPTPPLTEQLEAVKRISAIDGRVATEAENLRKLLLLKSGLMTDLLTGRVRVTPLLQEGTRP